jgi:endoglucanase
MPHLAIMKRYVIAKNTTATLDFATTMAQAYRILNRFKNKSPALPIVV